MRPALLITALTAAVLFTGCAGLSDADRRQFELLREDMATLQARLERTDTRVGELSSKFKLLREKVDENRAAPSEASGGPGLEPPEGLSVVRLENGRAEEAAEETEETKETGAQKKTRPLLKLGR